MSSTELCFNDFTFSPVAHQHNIWIRSVELADALGYASEKSVSNLYARNADEFSSEMSVVINLVTGGMPTETRIFSLRGCHLLAMFARTPVAKSFRRWVLDVLDRLAAEEGQAVRPAPSPLSRRSDPERKALTAIINTWVGMAPIHYANARAQVNAHFGLASVDAMTVAQVKEAIQWVQGKIDAEGKAKALPAAEGQPAHVFDRMGLTPLEKLRMGPGVKRMLDGLDMDKIGPTTLECLTLKAKYAQAIAEVYNLNRTLLQDLRRMGPDVNGRVLKALNKTGCFSDPAVDMLYGQNRRLDEINEEYRSVALAVLNSNICMGMMLGV